MQQCYARVGLQMRCGIASSYAQKCEQDDASTRRAASIAWRCAPEVIEPAHLEERRAPRVDAADVQCLQPAGGDALVFGAWTSGHTWQADERDAEPAAIAGGRRDQR